MMLPDKQHKRQLRRLKKSMLFFHDALCFKTEPQTDLSIHNVKLDMLAHKDSKNNNFISFARRKQYGFCYTFISIDAAEKQTSITKHFSINYEKRLNKKTNIIEIMKKKRLI